MRAIKLLVVFVSLTLGLAFAAPAEAAKLGCQVQCSDLKNPNTANQRCCLSRIDMDLLESACKDEVKTSGIAIDEATVFLTCPEEDLGDILRIEQGDDQPYRPAPDILVILNLAVSVLVLGLVAFGRGGRFGGGRGPGAAG